MTPNSRLFRAVLLAWVGVSPLWADTPDGDSDDALHWLQRMTEAVRHESYIGRFVYQHDDQLETLEIRHFATPEGEKSHLIALNGAATEILHDGDRVICVTPGKHAAAVRHYRAPKGLSPLIPRDAQRLAQAYEMRRLGESRVADRAAVVIGLLPKDAFRYGLRLFLDKRTALPLQADKLDREGHVLSRILFVSLMSGAEVAGFDDALHASSDLRHYVVPWRRQAEHEQAPESHPGGQRWRFTDLPPGYQLVSRRFLSGARSPVEQYIFSDGLSSFSVYVEPDSRGGADGLAHVGAVHAYGRALGKGHVTIVGEVPGETVERVARGILPADDPAPELAAAPDGG